MFCRIFPKHPWELLRGSQETLNVAYPLFAISIRAKVRHVLDVRGRRDVTGERLNVCVCVCGCAGANNQISVSHVLEQRTACLYWFQTTSGAYNKKTRNTRYSLSPITTRLQDSHFPTEGDYGASFWQLRGWFVLICEVNTFPLNARLLCWRPRWRRADVVRPATARERMSAVCFCRPRICCSLTFL